MDTFIIKTGRQQRKERYRMKREFGDKKRLEAVFMLALFYFVFLGMEYLYDNMMSYVTDARGVVLAESYILGQAFWALCCFRYWTDT